MTADQPTPTPQQIERAAIAWCGTKERETFPEDIAYFKYNCRFLPGLRRWVEEEVARGR